MAGPSDGPGAQAAEFQALLGRASKKTKSTTDRATNVGHAVACLARCRNTREPDAATLSGMATSLAPILASALSDACKERAGLKAASDKAQKRAALARVALNGLRTCMEVLETGEASIDPAGLAGLDVRLVECAIGKGGASDGAIAAAALACLPPAVACDVIAPEEAARALCECDGTGAGPHAPWHAATRSGALGRLVRLRIASKASDDDDTLSACRGALVSLASTSDLGAALCAIQALSGELAAVSTRRDDATAVMCGRSASYLLSDGASALLVALARLRTAVANDRGAGLELAQTCITITTLCRCVAMAGSTADGGAPGPPPHASMPFGAADRAVRPLLRALHAASAGRLGLSTQVLVWKAMLWLGVLSGPEADGGSHELTEALARVEDAAGPSGVPPAIASDAIREVLLCACFVPGQRAVGWLRAVRALASVDDPAPLEEAWRDAMGRGAPWKLAALSEALATVAASSSSSSGGHGGARATILMAVEFIAENANFALADYNWQVSEHEGAIQDTIWPAGLAEISTRFDPNAPALASVLAVLEGALGEQDWPVQSAVVRAVVTLGIRCSAGWREACHGVLERARRRSVAMLEPAVRQACAMLATVGEASRDFQNKVAAFGASPGSWPEDERAAVRQQHESLLRLAQSVCFVPEELYAPLGNGSRAFLAGAS